jgi:hypothetical protein
MYPDAITSAVQIGSPAPRPQGAPMNWKKALSDFLIRAAVFIPVLVLSNWKSVPHHHFRDFMDALLLCMTLTLGLIGVKELKRGGHQRIYRFYRGCFIYSFPVFLILTGILIGIAMFSKATGKVVLRETDVSDFVLQSYIYLLFAIVLAPFPLALYLNRNQKKTSAESTIADAN